MIVNYKLPGILNAIISSLSGVFLGPLLVDFPGSEIQIPSDPKMSTPDLFPKVEKFLKGNFRTFLLSQRTIDTLVAMTRKKYVSMVISNFAGKYLWVMLYSNLPNQVMCGIAIGPVYIFLLYFRIYSRQPFRSYSMCVR